jgi:hypothetical protein
MVRDHFAVFEREAPLDELVSKPMSTRTDQPLHPLAGAVVPSTPPRSAGDLTDWVELMEAVEALRPMWPEQPSRHAHQT